MNLLDRYLFRQIVSTLFKTLFSLVALYCVIDLLSERRNDILTHHVPFGVVVDYYAAFIPTLVYQVAPLAMLVSGLMVLGAAAQNNEVTAALAGGISLRRLVAVPVAVAVALSICMFFLDNQVGAASYRRAEQINTNYFKQDVDSQRAGVSWANLKGGWTCHILKFNRLALTGEHVYLYALRPNENEQIVARCIYWDKKRKEWMLEDGLWMVYAPDWSLRREQKRITLAPAPIHETPETLFALNAAPETKSSGQLAADIRRAEQRGLSAGTHWVSYYVKFSYPALSFVMIWLAIPFALRVRRGGPAISFGMSIAIALAYMIVYGACVSLGEIGELQPFVAAWFPNAVFLTTGLVLFCRTPT